VKKSKLDPKIIRIRDRVKIINPEVFIRCGYPLCKADVKEEIYQHYGKFIEDLVYSVSKGNEFLDRNNSSVELFNDENRSDRNANSKIMDALVSIRLVAKKFGGNERKIFTKAYDQLKGKTFYVTGIRFIQTGTYVSGYGGHFSGDYDYSLPYLSEPKIHKLLTLDVCRKEIDEDFKDKLIHIATSNGTKWKEYESIEIEACNVEKLPDEREFIQDKDGN